MKRTATILFAALPLFLWVAFTGFCVAEGKRNSGWHTLPFEGAKTLLELSKGRAWHFIDILAGVFFYGSGVAILVAYVFGALSALKKKSPLIALGISAAFILLIEGWALLIVVPTLVVPTG